MKMCALKLKGNNMKRLLIVSLLFFCAKIFASEIYTIPNNDNISIMLTEKECPYLQNSVFRLAIAKVENITIIGCWASDSDVVVINWSVNDSFFQQIYKVSDFVLMEII
jgi:hypothetical protein